MSGVRPSPAAALLVPVFAIALGACTSTTDSVGYDGVKQLDKIKGPDVYPNPFNTWIGKSQADIDAKITATWNQLFYGDPMNQAIYFPIGTDQAEIRDTYHGDIRTEGIGYAMMIAVQLDKRTEFDRMWMYVKSVLSYPMTEPSGGYFKSSCDRLPPQSASSCNDPFGHGQFVTALLFAKDRWGITGVHNYDTDAAALLDVMRHKEDMNGGIVNDVTNTFDFDTALPFHVPETKAAGISRPSIVMPAFYELWAQATHDPFWTRAATAARAYWKRTAHSTTGLVPMRAYFDGTPVENWEAFDSEAYRTQINMALDRLWFPRDPWESEEADKLLDFFWSKGLMSYGTSYTLEGEQISPPHDPALVAANGVIATISMSNNRNAFVTEVWNLQTPIAAGRYFSGILQLTALLILSGKYIVL